VFGTDGGEASRGGTDFRRGPIVIERGSTQLALGFGIAKGILVEPLG
jgi:hypothetical protein